MTAIPLELSMQGTPNPNAVKVSLNRTVAPRGTTYRDAATADVPWAKELLGVDGVTQVFAINNFVTITKRPESDWNAIGPQVEQILKCAFA